MFPEPLSGLLVLIVGMAMGRVGTWITTIKKNDDATAMAIVKLTGTVQHLDGTLLRLDKGMEQLYSFHNAHETRISFLEGTYGTRASGRMVDDCRSHTRTGGGDREPDPNA